MQMACILNMSNSWKKFTQLRIHVVESKNQPCPTTSEIEVRFFYFVYINLLYTGLPRVRLSQFFWKK